MKKHFICSHTPLSTWKKKLFRITPLFLRTTLTDIHGIAKNYRKYFKHYT